MAPTVSAAGPTAASCRPESCSLAREVVRQRTELADMGERVRDHLLIDDSDRFGDLKLLEPKTMWPLIAVRDREER
jgi:hypothetical protein